jgi:hypothetical protein
VLDFLKAVLPPTGPFCVAFRTQDKEKKGMIHRVVADQHALAKVATWGARKGWDAYFCVSSLKAPEWVDAAGKPHKRKKENAAKTQMFLLDIDVEAGSQRKYETQVEALEAIEKFTANIGLPNPIVVDSGYGYHVYWVLQKACPSDKWEKLAQYFKAIAVHLDPKLAADTSRIADCAGVLRLPGTMNFKKEEPKHVKIVKWSEETTPLLAFAEVIKKKAKELGIQYKPQLDKKKIPNLTVDLSLDVPHRFDLVVKRCQWMRHYVTHIPQASEVEWYRVLGLTKHLYHPIKSMAELAQMVSKGHPGYSWEATEAKFNQVRIAQTGPTLCATFRDLRPERCEGCPFAKIVTTPVRLDEVDIPDPKPLQIESTFTDIHGDAVVASVEAVPMPKPYFRGKDGGIYMHLDGGAIDGNDTDPMTVRKIYEYDLYPVSRLQNEDTGEEEIEVHLHLPKDGKKVIRVPNQVVIEPKAFAGYLTARGVLIKPHEVQPLVGYMVDYTRIIQKASSAQGVYNRFGWRHPQEHNAEFVLGDGMINAEGDFKPCMTATWLQDQKDFASSKGDLKTWCKAFDVIRMHSPTAYQFVGCLGFAAPLFALTPYHGLMFNLLGKGGIGKSTALKIMSSVWGKPTFTHILKKDNSIPFFNKIGYLNSIPVAYDEITMLPPDQTADIAYGVTEGRGKERAGRDGQTKFNFVKWSTIVVTCSNLSLYEKIGASKQGNAAPAYRIFETKVDGVEQRNQIKIETAIRTLMDNYGIAGRTYMQYVVKNRKTIIERLIAEEVEITEHFKLRTAERYWGGMFATLAVGADICNHLGLHLLKKADMLQWAYEELDKARYSLNDSQGNAVNILSDFINTNLHATIFMSEKGINAYGLQNSPQRELHIRLEKFGGKFSEGFISQSAFKRYCADNKIEYQWVVNDLLDMRAIKKGTRSFRLGAGTQFSGGPVSVVSLDFSSPYWKDEVINEPEPGGEIVL